MKKGLSLILLFCSLLFSSERTVIREYTYKASDYDSKITSREKAIEQVNHLLLQEISLFIFKGILTQYLEGSVVYMGSINAWFILGVKLFSNFTG